MRWANSAEFSHSLVRAGTIIGSLLLALAVRAELRVPSIIGENMVLQQRQANPVWGWDTPGSEVTVTFSGQTKRARADASGKWRVTLDPVPASLQPATLNIRGSTSREIRNVLVGEVWLCSGQSNMEFKVGQSYDADLEQGLARYPHIRLITVPHVGTQEPQKDFKGQWRECSPQNVGAFSGVGYFFGRTLYQMLGVPIGLIDTSWGSSKCEAWIRRDLLEHDPRFKDLIAEWRTIESTYDHALAQAEYKSATAVWKKNAELAKAAGRPAPRAPRTARDPLIGQHRPGNLYAGVLHPLIGYGIKGVAWFQGEGNNTRAYEYGYLFPKMIQHWRDEWKQGDFPFYWVQLADFQPEKSEPGDANFAELRESQTKAMKLPNTGQAVVIDLGEGNDIHPRNKRDVGMRLARWPLAKDYGFKVAYRSPEFQSIEILDGKAVLSFDCFGSTLMTRDVDEVRGFAVCGDDRKWFWATAVITGPNQITVNSPQVKRPHAVRYAWADNPVCNVYNKVGLPLTPFRTDDFPMVTMPAGAKAESTK